MVNRKPNGYGLAARSKADESIPPTTPEQARKAALHVVENAGENADEILDMLGIRELLRG